MGKSDADTPLMELWEPDFTGSSGKPSFWVESALKRDNIEPSRKI